MKKEVIGAHVLNTSEVHSARKLSLVRIGILVRTLLSVTVGLRRYFPTYWASSQGLLNILSLFHGIKGNRSTSGNINDFRLVT